MKIQNFGLGLIIIAIVALFFIVVYFLWSFYFEVLEQQKKIEVSTGLVSIWADQLDGDTTSAGTYIKYNDANQGELPEKDAWGHNLLYQYSRGGAIEAVKVRSIGRDGKPGTKDDIVYTKRSVNLAGVGSGIRDNIEATTENGGRGLIRGSLQGLKEELTPEWLDSFKKEKK